VRSRRGLLSTEIWLGLGGAVESIWRTTPTGEVTVTTSKSDESVKNPADVEKAGFRRDGFTKAEKKSQNFGRYNARLLRILSAGRRR